MPKIAAHPRLRDTRPPRPAKTPPPAHFPIAGIGASAGGFEALMELMRQLPAKCGMAFVVVLHLDPKHESRLTELVAKAAKMPVEEIRNGVRVEKNRVYVLPSNRDVALRGGVLKLTRRAENRRLPHLPIDSFFESLADDRRNLAIGVILSGTGSDGTAGLGAIKAAGGVTFAQAELSAKFPAMPHNAVAAGCVDAVRTPGQIARELAGIARHPYVAGGPQEKPEEAGEEMPDPAGEFHKLLYLLKHHTGVDFSLYKPNTLRRRIARRMLLQQVEKPEQYYKLLKGSAVEMDALFDDLLINVTGFFRDPAAFEALKRKVLAKLAKVRHGGEIRVWVPGCATGEEAYSIAIALVEVLGRGLVGTRVQVFGTDLSEIAIAKARLGIFPETIARNVSPERLHRFFTKSEGGYQINRAIRDLCTFARQNLCQDPPFGRLDLVSCRNVLIYLSATLQKRVLPTFHYALKPGGFLFLGNSETIGGFADRFALADKAHRIYAKKSTGGRPGIEFTGAGLGDFKPLPARLAPAITEADAVLDLQRQVDRMILAHHAPGGVVVDADLQVRHFCGNTAPYFTHAHGAASLNLLQLAHPGLVVELRTIIHRALKQNATVLRPDIVFPRNGGPRAVSIEAVPFKGRLDGERCVLVLFREEPGARVSAGVRRGKGPPSRAEEREDTRLREELDSTKQTLQAIIEEQDASNEELKSANEEIESANEELQSTNEELETAKEELQSTNEELTTLNEELSNRNLAMGELNNDLTNLLHSISIPIVMVDNELAVRRMTPAAERLFNLLPKDVGRRLTDFRPKVEIPDLEELIHQVIGTLAPFEREVRDAAGRWYSLRIRPYRTRDNKIDGAVITLLDIDDIKHSQEKLEVAAEFSEAVIDTVRHPVLVLDGELRVRRANPAFYAAFKTKPAKTENAFIYNLGNGQWDSPQLRRLLEEILPQNARFEDFKVAHTFPGIGPRTMLLNARRIERGGDRRILLAIEDATAKPRRG